jgi:hypothetical protein
MEKHDLFRRRSLGLQMPLFLPANFKPPLDGENRPY